MFVADFLMLDVLEILPNNMFNLFSHLNFIRG